MTRCAKSSGANMTKFERTLLIGVVFVSATISLAVLYWLVHVAFIVWGLV